MDHDDTRDNVLALFPGIDTTPFARGADLAELSDDGWSGTPEQSVVVDAAVADTGRPSARPAGHPRRVLAGGIAALALLAGVSVSLAHSLLRAPAVRGPGSATSTHSPGKTLAALLPHGHLGARSVADQSGRRAFGPRERHVRVVAHARRHRPAVGTGTTEVGYVPPAQPGQPLGNTTADSTSAGSSSQAASTSSADSSNSRGASAGPTGAVSLIGAGTTPSG